VFTAISEDFTYWRNDYTLGVVISIFNMMNLFSGNSIFLKLPITLIPIAITFPNISFNEHIL